MPTRFLRLTEQEALVIAADNTQIYTPGYNSLPKYFFYKDNYTKLEEVNTVELTDLELEGLTPIDPTKPMFPKKPK